MTRNTVVADDSRIVNGQIADLLSERYLSYALSTIMSRSLPDVRDGLKPVHRRLLFAMSQLKLGSQTGPKKSARVVGDVIGKFHPHGDQSVYDALVRLAQDFAVRYPLVDGQGNFGNIDGDNAAAMRYTEARMTKVAELLLEGLEENAVDYRATYDGDGSEPIVMPANFPNLLANGSTGIAVGMATNIPPHNVFELCEAMELMLKGDASIEALVACVPGPDFPTGGTLVEPAGSVLETYRTGRGSFRLRAKWVREELKQGVYQIVVTEIPYQVQKSKLIERIADLIQNKKLPMLDDVRDESAEDIRLVLVPKSRNVAPEILMETLYRQTELETRFGMNMNVLDHGIVPRVMNLKEVLQAWLDHRKVVLVRRSTHRLEQVLHRLEVLAGYLIVYLNIDEVIRIIRAADEPKADLMASFGLSEIQAEAVLNIRLRALARLEEIGIRKEHDALSAERDALQKLIGSEPAQWSEIKRQIGALKKQFSADSALGRRRTIIGDAPSLVAVDIGEALIEKEPVTIILSAKGWIRALKGHRLDAAEFKYKDGDEALFTVEAMTTDKLLMFCCNGRFYTLGCDKLPAGRGFGEPVRLLIDMPNDAEIVTVKTYDPEGRLLIASRDGRGFVLEEKQAIAQTRAGKQILNLSDGELATFCVTVGSKADHIATVGTNRKMLIFPLQEVPVLPKGRGVMLQKFKDGKLSDIRIFSGATGLTFKYGAGESTVQDITPWFGSRASAGRMPPNGFPKNNRFG